MTLDLDDLERIGKAATAGPWEIDFAGVNEKDTGTWFVCREDADGPPLMHIPTHHNLTAEADSDFVVTARNNWQAMIDELRRLRANEQNARVALREAGESEADTCVDPVFSVTVLMVGWKAECDRLRAENERRAYVPENPQ